MKRILSLLCALLVVAELSAARIDTVAVFSPKMERAIETLVIVPEAEATQAMPVLYLLHGYGGDHTAWQKITDLRPLAEQYGMLIVCPDGENSWYWDSPTRPDSQFETFVSTELPAWVDAHYRTIPSREGRAITGLSMGGHGGLWIGIRHKHHFGAAGATSGGVDIRPFPKNWRMAEQLGTKEEQPERWNNYTVINQVETLQEGELAIIFDCGYDDFFYEVNCNLHAKLRKAGISHDFLVRPGAHNKAYWRISLPYQLLFFRNFFDRQNP